MFLNNVVVKEHPKEHFKWILYEDLIYEFPHSLKKLTIPKGFTTDFASVPKSMWNIIPPYGRYKKEAVLHDYLYATALFKKNIADNLFLISMKEAGVPSWKRKTMYLAVKFFGEHAWKTHRFNQSLAKVNKEDYPKLMY